MANEYAVNQADLTAVADAIRAKGGTSEALTFPGGFVDAVGAIQAGVSSGGLAYDMGEFVLDADSKGAQSVGNPNWAIAHQLGDTPEFVMVWTDDFAGLTADNTASQQCNLGFIWLNNPIGLLQRLSSSASGDALTINLSVASGDYRTNAGGPSSVMYAGIKPTSEVFYYHASGGNNYWRAGVSYKYFVSKAWWNIGGVTNAE